MKNLTARQRQVLELLDGYLASGVPPSSARLAHELGLAGESSLTPVLKALVQKGYLLMEGGVKGRQRTIRLTPKAQREVGRGLPVLGSIPAGPLREAIQNSEVFVERLEQVLPYQDGDFLLRVDGDSMIGAGIESGDHVLIRPQVELRSGEIAAVCVGDDYQATLKKVWLDPSNAAVRLQSANPRYPDSTYPAEQVRVVGVMRGLVRSSA